MLVTKDELFAAIWPDVIVTENALTQAISDLRQALGDEPASPTYIQTVARRGYRFIAPVEALPAVDADPRGARRGRARGRAGHGAIGGGAGFRQPRRRPRTRVARHRHRRDGDQRPDGVPRAPRRGSGAHRRSRPAHRRLDDAPWRATSTSTSSSSAASSAPAIGCGSPRGSWTCRPAPRWPTPRWTAASRTSSISRTASSAQFSAAARRRDGARAVDAHGRARDIEPRRVPRGVGSARQARQPGSGPGRRAAAEGFEHAVRLDPRYAMAYAGLANAHSCSTRPTRARNEPDAAQARDGHRPRAAVRRPGRHAGRGHATLAFLLVSAGKFAEAVAAGRRAVALDPHDWRHLFRLGHAAWGSERLDALARALTIYGDLAFAHFEIAMVHIARNQLPTGRRGAAPGRRAAGPAGRAGSRAIRPAASTGCWGWCCLAQGETRPRARRSSAANSRPASAVASRVWGREFAMNAHDGCGFALLADAAGSTKSADAFAAGAAPVPRPRAIANRPRAGARGRGPEIRGAGRARRRPRVDRAASGAAAGMLEAALLSADGRRRAGPADAMPSRCSTGC